jgi:uncharacterized protein (DUF2267 family)
MEHDALVGHVRHRARLASRGEADRALRATLETLAERLDSDMAENLASQLPTEIGGYPLTAPAEFQPLFEGSVGQMYRAA